jgi:hypothetical protein
MHWKILYQQECNLLCKYDFFGYSYRVNYRECNVRTTPKEWQESASFLC